MPNSGHDISPSSVWRRLRVAIALLLGVVGSATVAYVLLLDAPWFDSFYMVIITLSTVGYGETIPVHDNTAAEAVTLVVILSGTTLLLYVLSALTAFFVEGDLAGLLRRRRMEADIQKMRDHLIVCGIGRTGRCVLPELVSVGVPFVVLERNQEHVNEALEHAEFPYLLGDATSEELLRTAGIERARGLFATLSNDKDNLFLSFTARQLNPELRIVARGVDAGIADRIAKAGADAVVSPNRIGGLRIASEMVRPAVVGFLDRMLRECDETWRFEEVEVPAGSAVVGRDLGSLEIASRVGLPVIALTSSTGEVSYYPDDDTRLDEGARLVFLAEQRHLETLRGILRS